MSSYDDVIVKRGKHADDDDSPSLFQKVWKKKVPTSEDSKRTKCKMRKAGREKRERSRKQKS